MKLVNWLKSFRLIDDAGEVFLKLWTVKLSIVSAIYSTAAGAWVLMPYSWQPNLSEPVKWVLASIGVILAASPAVARIIAQPNVITPKFTVRQPDDSNEAGA